MVTAGRLWRTESWDSLGSGGSNASSVSLAERVERNRSMLQEMLNIAQLNCYSSCERHTLHRHKKDAPALGNDEHSNGMYLFMRRRWNCRNWRILVTWAGVVIKKQGEVVYSRSLESSTGGSHSITESQCTFGSSLHRVADRIAATNAPSVWKTPWNNFCAYSSEPQLWLSSHPSIHPYIHD